MDREKYKSRIDALINELLELREDVDSLYPPTPPAAKLRNELGLCVSCGAPMDGEIETRGCHSSCFQAIRREIKEKRTTDIAEMALGNWLAPNVTGRPTKKTTGKRKSRSIATTSDDQTVSVATSIATDAAKERKRKNAKTASKAAPKRAAKKKTN